MPGPPDRSLFFGYTVRSGGGLTKSAGTVEKRSDGESALIGMAGWWPGQAFSRRLPPSAPPLPLAFAPAVLHTPMAAPDPSPRPLSFLQEAFTWLTSLSEPAAMGLRAGLPALWSGGVAQQASYTHAVPAPHLTRLPCSDSTATSFRHLVDGKLHIAFMQGIDVSAVAALLAAQWAPPAGWAEFAAGRAALQALNTPVRRPRRSAGRGQRRRRGAPQRLEEGRGSRGAGGACSSLARPARGCLGCPSPRARALCCAACGSQAD